MTHYAHFWEYQLTDSHGVETTWQRYDPTVQQFILDHTNNSNPALLKIEDSDIEIIFDHENGNHRHRDMNTGSECAVRKTPEVIVDDWNVFKAMVDVSKITKLDLSGSWGYKIPKINEDDVHELVERINHCESLRILDLSRNNLTDVFGVALGEVVATHTTLVTLELSDNKFGEETGIALAAVLTNTSLHTLSILRNNLRETGGAAIIRGLIKNTTLRVLDLMSNNLGENFGVAIQDDLKNTGLHELQLGKNGLGDNGGAAIIRGLKNNATLRILDLHSNNLGENFGVAVQDDLANNTGLHTLDLGHNDLRDKGGAAIIRGLKNNTTLHQLALRFNNLRANFGVAIQDDLANNTGLHTLYLGDNELRDSGGAAIIRALKYNTTLRNLALQMNGFGENFGVAIQGDLTNNTGLHTLNLALNNFGEASGAAFVEVLTQNSNLTTLGFGFNPPFPPATLAKIKFALSPELKGLLNDPSVPPSRIPVCVVGFDNVGKTELINTWHRTTAHDNPHLDPEETAPAQAGDYRDKTSGISINPVTLRLDTMPPSAMLETPTNRQQTEEIPNTVDIIAWDFAGHTQYFLSHELMMRACRGAVFVLLFRIDSLQPDVCYVEQQQLFFWLKFIASMSTNQQQPPTVFIGGSFRPDDDAFDVEATTEWTDSLLQHAKEVFDGVLNLLQHSIYHMDCRKSNDPHVVALRNALAQAVEEIRTREDRKVPPICEYATSVLHNATQEVTSRLVLFEEQLEARRSNPNMSVTTLSWQGTVCAPMMTRVHFEEHVLGKLEVKADGVGAANAFVDDLYNVYGRRNQVTSVPTFGPKSKQLLQIITTYLHDVGDILWFDVDGLRDTVILTPDLFCSKIIGAIFRPDAPGFSIDAVHGGGGLVPKSSITVSFKRALGIDDIQVDAALAILCQLGLCHRHQDARSGEDSYLFPGALAATSYRLPEWFGPLPPGLRFVVGRRFTLSDPATTIFAPGCMPEIQVWALGRYKGSRIWRDGVVIPYTATKTLAEAGVQLYRPHNSSQDGDKCALVSISSITLVVRGSDAAAQPDCLRLLDELCEKIRATSGTQLVEEALPPNELALLAANKDTNMLDITSPGYDVSPIVTDDDTNDDVISSCDDTSPSASLFPISPVVSLHPEDVVVGGKRHQIDSLRNGAYVEVVCALVTVDRPSNWTGNDFAAVSPSCVDGGVDLTAEVTQGSCEFDRIQKNMRRSLPNAVITRIDRVQNKSLWGKYVLAKADIASSIPNPLEILAWHSTRTTDPRLIYSDWKAGFDVNRSIIEIKLQRNASGDIVHWEFVKACNKSYGTGVYLAEHAIYPDTIFPHVRPQNTADGGKKQLLLAKVVLGNCLDHKSTIPDLRAAIEPEGYHSITGTEDDMKFLLEHRAALLAQNGWTNAHEQLVVQGAEYGRQYVVHRSNQVYPAYLITYEHESHQQQQQQQQQQ